MDGQGTVLRRSNRLASQTPRSPYAIRQSSPSRHHPRVNFSHGSSPPRLPIRAIAGDEDGDVFNDALEGVVRQRLFTMNAEQQQQQQFYPQQPVREHGYRQQGESRFSRLRESLSSHVSPHLSRVINRLPASGSASLIHPPTTAKPAKRVVNRLPEQQHWQEDLPVASREWPLAVRLPIWVLRAAVWLLVNGLVLTWFLLTLPVRLVNFTLNNGGWLRRLFVGMLSLSIVAMAGLMAWWLLAMGATRRELQAREALILRLNVTQDQLQHEQTALARQLSLLSTEIHQIESQMKEGVSHLQDKLPQLVREQLASLPQPPVALDSQGKLTMDPRLTAHLRQLHSETLNLRLKEPLEALQSRIDALEMALEKVQASRPADKKAERENSKTMPKRRAAGKEAKASSSVYSQSSTGASNPPTQAFHHDYALKVIDASASYQPPFRWDWAYLLRWLGIKGPHLVHPPSMILHSNLSLGDCWPMAGHQGRITVRLSKPIIPRSFTLKHSTLSPDPSSAPQNLEVYGLGRKGEEILLASHQFHPADESTHHFLVSKVVVEPVLAVQLRILSNWGRPEYTCLYRFHVYED